MAAPAAAAGWSGAANFASMAQGVSTFVGPFEKLGFSALDWNRSKDAQKRQEQYELLNMWVAQQFAKESALLDYNYQSALQGQSTCAQRALATLQNSLSKELNDYNSQRDYLNAVKYISDSLGAYKSALQRNGWNPLLALGQSVPTYTGGAHSAVSAIPSVASAGGVHTGSGPSASAPSLHVPSSSSALASTDMARSFGDLAERSSVIARNEAEAEMFKANANKTVRELEDKHPLEVKDLKEHPAKTKSETIKNYSSVGSSILNSAGTAYAAKKASDAVQAFKSDPKPTFRKFKYTIKAINGNPAARGNSAHLGSRIMQSILPLTLTGGLGYLGGISLMNDIKSSSDKSETARRYDTLMNALH